MIADSLTFTAEEVHEEINGQMYQVIKMIIKNNSIRFGVRGASRHILVKDSNMTIEGFMTVISGNQKEITALFTVDAFNVFMGLVDINIRYANEEPTEFIENVDIQSNIQPLNTTTYPGPATIVTNAWLASNNF